MVTMLLGLVSPSTMEGGPSSSGLVKRLIGQREELVQPGLSYINSSSPLLTPMALSEVRNLSCSSQVTCVINIENWSKWLLDDPVYYIKYGAFRPMFHEREVFPSHREVVVLENDGEDSFTGTSGTMAWELEKQGVHMVVMWSVPYNLNIYNSYFAVGVVQLNTKFSRDMLPYWYEQMLNHRIGRTFQRGKEGESLVFKHQDFFVIGMFGEGYHPVLNISLMPWNTKDFAPSIWHKMYVNSLRTVQSAYSRATPASTINISLSLLVVLFFTPTVPHVFNSFLVPVSSLLVSVLSLLVPVLSVSMLLFDGS